MGDVGETRTEVCFGPRDGLGGGDAAFVEEFGDPALEEGL